MVSRIEQAKELRFKKFERKEEMSIVDTKFVATCNKPNTTIYLCPMRQWFDAILKPIIQYIDHITLCQLNCTSPKMKRPFLGDRINLDTLVNDNIRKKTLTLFEFIRNNYSNTCKKDTCKYGINCGNGICVEKSTKKIRNRYRICKTDWTNPGTCLFSKMYDNCKNGIHLRKFGIFDEIKTETETKNMKKTKYCYYYITNNIFSCLRGIKCNYAHAGELRLTVERDMIINCIFKNLGIPNRRWIGEPIIIKQVDMKNLHMLTCMCMNLYIPCEYGENCINGAHNIYHLVCKRDLISMHYGFCTNPICIATLHHPFANGAVLYLDDYKTEEATDELYYPVTELHKLLQIPRVKVKEVHVEVKGVPRVKVKEVPAVTPLSPLEEKKLYEIFESKRKTYNLT